MASDMMCTLESSPSNHTLQDKPFFSFSEGGEKRFALSRYKIIQ